MARTKTDGPVKARTPPLQGNTRWATETRYPGPITTRISGSGKGTTNLLDLPNEVILIILSHYRLLRLQTTQAQAHRHSADETDRQYENYYRRITLHALCLTCKRLNWLAIPTLYSSFVGSTTLYGMVPLRLYWKTFMEHPELYTCLEYVENVLSDCLGNSLENDVKRCGEELVQNYFEKLADIIRLAPNIQQMSIISIETEGISLWASLIQQRPPEYEIMEIVSKNGLAKLEKASIQVNGSGDELWGFEQIFYSLLGCPALTELHIRGAASGIGRGLPSNDVFKHLQRLDLTECNFTLQSLDNAISLCPGLRHLRCHWSHAYQWIYDRSTEFLPSLSKLQHTLETLWLLASDLLPPENIRRPVLSLKNMSSLKEAKLSNIFIAGMRTITGHAETVSEVPLAPKLPASLERLMIFYTTRNISVEYCRRLANNDLMRLAEDCPSSLPCLKELAVHFEDEGGDIDNRPSDRPTKETIVQAFAEQGVTLTFTGGLDVLALLEELQVS